MNNSTDYTFEDWLEDSQTYYEIDFGEHGKHDQMKKGTYPKRLYNQGKISEDTFKKIKGEQEKAYEIAVEYHIGKAIEKLNSNVEQAVDAVEYLTHQKKHLEKAFDKAQPETLEPVLLGEKKLEPITAGMYKEIMNNQDSPPTLKAVSDIYTGMDKYDKRNEISPHFRYKILFAEYQKVKELLTNQTDGKINKEALLKSFTVKFSKKTKYERELIHTYLKSWIEFDNIPNKRARAKEELEQQNFDVPADGTLKNWEEKWTEFYNSRTGK